MLSPNVDDPSQAGTLAAAFFRMGRRGWPANRANCPLFPDSAFGEVEQTELLFSLGRVANDGRWDRFKDLLPGQPSTVGVSAADNLCLSKRCSVGIAPDTLA